MLDHVRDVVATLGAARAQHWTARDRARLAAALELEPLELEREIADELAALERRVGAPTRAAYNVAP